MTEAFATLTMTNEMNSFSDIRSGVLPGRTAQECRCNMAILILTAGSFQFLDQATLGTLAMMFVHLIGGI